MVCLKKMLNGEMSFKKDTETIVLLKVEGLIHIKKKLHISIICHQLSFRAVAPKIAIGLGTKYFVAIKARDEWQVYISLKKNKLACFSNS